MSISSSSGRAIRRLENIQPINEKEHGSVNGEPGHTVSGSPDRHAKQHHRDSEEEETGAKKSEFEWLDTEATPKEDAPDIQNHGEHHILDFRA